MARALQQVDLIAVGDPGGMFTDAVGELQRRISGLVQLRVAQIPGKPANPKFGTPISEEARAVAATIESIEAERGGPFPILLGDHYGETPTSQELALTYNKLPYLCVVIGGIHGLHDLLGERDVRRVSLGRITLSPMLARVVMLDQLYRLLLAGDGIAYPLE